MAVIEDLLDELYTLDNSRWYDNVTSVLNLLSFPVRWSYTCGWEEYLYERLEQDKYTTSSDRKTLRRCREIAYFEVAKQFHKIKVIAVLIEGNTKTKNETVYDISKVFNKLYGRYVILAFVFRNELAFAGTMLLENKKSEIIISDWFSYDRSFDINERLLGIDFSLFSENSYKNTYKDYLWAISRDYIRYQESKMFLVFECGEAVKKEAMVFNEKTEMWEEVEVIDFETTLHLNSRYYPDCYDNDYFYDDSADIYMSEDYLNADDSADFEWTMLEMDLDEEIEDNELEEDLSDLAEYDDNETLDMDPSEMLQYIRNNDSL